MNQLSYAPLPGHASVSDIILLGERMFKESRFSKLEFSFEKAKRYAFDVLTNPEYISVGAFFKRELVGMILGDCGDVLPFTHDSVATEHLLYVDPGFREVRVAFTLIQQFIAQAKERGAKDIIFSNGTGYEPERVGKLFERCGMTKVGGIYYYGG